MNGDIVRCGGNGRVGKKGTLLFPAFHYLPLLTIYSDEKRGERVS